MNERQSSKVPEFKPSLPADIIPGLDDKDKYLFERIDILTQSMNWQCDNIYEINATLDKIDTDTKELKNFRNRVEQSSSLKTAVDTVKQKTTHKLKRLALPALALFLGLIYPAYLEAYTELGGSVVIKNIVEYLIP